MNAADQRYCTSCGAALGERCPACGASNAVDARFCGTCGASLTEPITGEALASELRGEERKVVSVLFADLVGSTAAADAADPEDIQARLRPYHARVRGEITLRRRPPAPLARRSRRSQPDWTGRIAISSWPDPRC